MLYCSVVKFEQNYNFRSNSPKINDLDEIPPLEEIPPPPVLEDPFLENGLIDDPPRLGSPAGLSYRAQTKPKFVRGIRPGRNRLPNSPININDEVVKQSLQVSLNLHIFKPWPWGLYSYKAETRLPKTRNTLP